MAEIWNALGRKRRQIYKRLSRSELFLALWQRFFLFGKNRKKAKKKLFFVCVFKIFPSARYFFSPTSRPIPWWG